MTNSEDSRSVFRACTHFLNHHRPVPPKQALSDLAASVGADEGSDNYGTGKLITQFESQIAELLGKEAAVFMPSGTMAQVIALRIWADLAANKKIGLHPSSHLELHEQLAYRHLHGLQALVLGEPDRRLALEDFRDGLAEISCALVELPQRELGGVCMPWDELCELARQAKEAKTKLHLDGARLWEVQPYYNRSHAEICSHFDSVYVSFYKGLGGLAGAVLAGPEAFIQEARIWQRRQGGNLKVLFPYVIGARAGLQQRLGKMPLYWQKAIEIADALHSIEGIRTQPHRPQANMVHVFLRGGQAALELAALEIARHHRVALFHGLMAGREHPWFELTVGDAALEIPTARIADLFRDLMKRV